MGIYGVEGVVDIGHVCDIVLAVKTSVFCEESRVRRVRHVVCGDVIIGEKGNGVFHCECGRVFGEIKLCRADIEWELTVYDTDHTEFLFME